AVGPTTASRMDFATPQLFEAGIVATIGKGRRSDEVATACRETGSVCFSAVGGAAAFLGSKAVSSELIAWDDLGTEALRKLELDGLPVFVTIDSKGNQLGKISHPNISSNWDVFAAKRLSDSNTNSADKGIFITFEGGEGVGKSTQIKLLAARLEAAGIEVLCLREPGGTTIGESIRTLLLDPNTIELGSMSELLLYEASRAQLTEEVILPALQQGVTVLCDRYIDSTTAYQGYARGLNLDLVACANLLGSNGLLPDRTIVLELDVGVSLGKATKDGADRLEAEGLEFHTLVHQGFAQIAAQDAARVRRVQCQELKQDTAMAVFDQVSDLFPSATASDMLEND
ncbi:MAG: dTMP kinase, partial [Coriobacteriaceae bacterium]|nr:dTMP kinase [Coriobacteriaceae bacterium]